MKGQRQTTVKKFFSSSLFVDAFIDLLAVKVVENVITLLIGRTIHETSSPQKHGLTL